MGMASVTVTPTDWAGNPIGDTRTIALDDGTLDDSMPPMKASVPEIKEWVGYDPDRAKAALVREHGSDKPRTGLIETLERVLKGND